MPIELEYYIKNRQGDLNRVRCPSSAEKETLGQLLPGVVFLHTGAGSFNSLVSEDSGLFNARYLDSIRTQYALRSQEFSELDVAIHPGGLLVPDTLGLSFEQATEKIQAYSIQHLEPRLPDAKAIILPPYSLIRVDQAYASHPETAGKTLFKEGEYFHALNYASVFSTIVGKSLGSPQPQYDIDSWEYHKPARNIGTLLAIVFLEKAKPTPEADRAKEVFQFYDDLISKYGSIKTSVDPDDGYTSVDLVTPEIPVVVGLETIMVELSGFKQIGVDPGDNLELYRRNRTRSISIRASDEAAKAVLFIHEATWKIPDPELELDGLISLYFNRGNIASTWTGKACFEDFETIAPLVSESLRKDR